MEADNNFSRCLCEVEKSGRSLGRSARTRAALTTGCWNNVGALIIRIGFGAYIFGKVRKKGALRNNACNYLGPYSTPATKLSLGFGSRSCRFIFCKVFLFLFLPVLPVLAARPPPSLSSYT